MDKITPHDYIKLLKDTKIVNRKHLQWIYKIVLYTNEGVVYKILIQYHYQTLKKARKYGITSEYNLIDNVPNLLLDTEKIYLTNTKMFSYDQTTQEFTIFEGEEINSKPCLRR